MREISPRRKQIIELLQLLASEEEQLAYEKNVPHADITTELLCMWFDDQYHPDLRHFGTCFNPEELNALEEFHRFYGERADRLPESQGTVRTWLADPTWQEVMQKAKNTLEKIVA